MKEFPNSEVEPPSEPSFEGDEAKVAKNVENMNDAAYVKAKGTWYRARRCHKVKCSF